MIYLDSCALLKLVVPESESVALAAFLRTSGKPLATSELTTVEIHRALTRIESDETVRRKAESLFARLLRLPLTPVIARAAALPGQHLRSLDALHLATAELLVQPLVAFVTYDTRLAKAATDLGLPVHAPR